MIKGSNFGPHTTYIDLLKLGDTELGSNSNALCIMTVPHTEIQCKTRPGTGYSLPLRLVIKNQRASCRNETVTCKLSYFKPQIYKVIGPIPQSICKNRLLTQGNESVVLDGDMFGPPELKSLRIRTTKIMNVFRSNISSSTMQCHESACSNYL